jgi:hypothetical protein
MTRVRRCHAQTPFRLPLAQRALPLRILAAGYLPFICSPRGHRFLGSQRVKIKHNLLVFGFSALRAEKPNTEDRKVSCCRRQNLLQTQATAYVLSLTAVILFTKNLIKQLSARFRKGSKSILNLADSSWENCKYYNDIVMDSFKPYNEFMMRVARS